MKSQEEPDIWSVSLAEKTEKHRKKKKEIQGTRDPIQETAMGILGMMVKGNARKKTLQQAWAAASANWKGGAWTFWNVPLYQGIWWSVSNK